METDEIDPRYKDTAIKAAKEMPKKKNLSIRVRSVWNKLVKAHPEIDWGVVGNVK